MNDAGGAARRIPAIAMTVTLLVVGGAAGGASAQEADAGRLTLERYLEWERVSDPRIAPDGERVIYTRRWVDRFDDRWRGSLWIVGADGTRNRRLVEEGSTPRWSPDGTRIAYSAPGDPRGRQIFVRWMDGEGGTSQITRLERGPSELRWSPDGEWIAFTSEVDARSGFAGVALPDRPEGASWTGEPKVVERASYRADRRGYVDETWRHVFVVPSDGGAARRLTDGERDHRDIAWSPDGSEIYFSARREEAPATPATADESEIYAVEVEGGRIRPLTDRSGPDAGPLPSPDGSRIAYTGVDRHGDAYRNHRIHLMERDGSNPRVISDGFDRRVRSLRWAPDGSGLYFHAESEGARHLYFVSADDGVRQVTRGEQVVSLSTISGDGRAAATVAGPHEPADVWTFDPERPAERTRLTRVNADVLDGLELGDVEEIRYESEGGMQIQGWIVKPPDFDPSHRYPLILAIHGGPHAMYDVGFSFAFQEHASNGYVVLYTNPRGSTGYGSEFANAIDHAYPGADVPDLMTGVDSLVARGWVDEENLFVYGCSGGGILTSYIVTVTDRFAAASANCPIVNWISAMGTSDLWSYTRTFGSYFWEDPSEWIDRSSIFRVGEVSTPTMLMVGENDLRTPVPETEQFYQALKIRDVPTVMVRFRDEWHGTTSKPTNFLRTQLYLRKWFERWGTHDARLTADAGGS